MPPSSIRTSRARTSARTSARTAIGAALAAASLVGVTACGGGDPAALSAGGAGTTAGPTTSGPSTTAVATSSTYRGTTSLLGAPVPVTDPPTTVAPSTAPPTTRPRTNVYASIGTPNPVTAGHRYLVYVPHEVGGITMVIDPTTFQVIDTIQTGAESHHVVPSWDMSTLYVAASRGDLLTPIDPATGRAGAGIPVDDPYNLYWTPDGSEAVVVEEGNQRLTFRDPKTFAFHSSLQTQCSGLNHADYTVDGRYMVASCEFEGSMIKVDMVERKVVGKIPIFMGPSGKTPTNGHSQPQDVRLSPDGTFFYVADLQSEGLYLIDADSFTQVGYLRTGVGTHGIYPNHDGSRFYVINRGTPIVGGPPNGQGSVAVLDTATNTIVATWPIPGGGSPDMGNLSPDGSQLWLGGRYDSEVYVFDTETGTLAARIPVGSHPHGLTVWPQPGRYSLGHTGNMR